METLVPEILLTMSKCAPNDGWRVGSTGTKVKIGNKLLAGQAGTARPRRSPHCRQYVPPIVDQPMVREAMLRPD